MRREWGSRLLLTNYESESRVLVTTEAEIAQEAILNVLEHSEENMTNDDSMNTVHKMDDSHVGKCTGWAYPYGSWVRVSSGMGTGNNSATRDLQNKPKNIFFGGELNEI